MIVHSQNIFYFGWMSFSNSKERIKFDSFFYVMCRFMLPFNLLWISSIIMFIIAILILCFVVVLLFCCSNWSTQSIILLHIEMMHRSSLSDKIVVVFLIWRYLYAFFLLLASFHTQTNYTKCNVRYNKRIILKEYLFKQEKKVKIKRYFIYR